MYVRESKQVWQHVRLLNPLAFVFFALRER